MTERDRPATLQALHVQQREVLARRGRAHLRVVEPVRAPGLEIVAERDHVEVRQHEPLRGVHEHAARGGLLSHAPGADVHRSRPGLGDHVVENGTGPARLAVVIT